MFSIPLLLTIYAGFTHAFEADHLLAVSNIVSTRNNIKLSMKDGIFWGLGHSSTILFIGIIMLVLRVGISDTYFHYFEALVGLMLIILGAYRLFKFFKHKGVVLHTHTHDHGAGDHQHYHVHLGQKEHHHNHSVAYGVGLVHGLAGSGALILIVMTQVTGTLQGLLYLIIFSSGCVLGMLVAAGLFSVPFSRKIMKAKALQVLLIMASSALCLLYGGKVIYDNIFIN